MFSLLDDPVCRRMSEGTAREVVYFTPITATPNCTIIFDAAWDNRLTGLVDWSSGTGVKAAAGFLDEGDPSGVLALRGCSGDGALTCWIFLKKALCNRSLRPLLGVLAVKAFLGDRPRSEPKKASDWVGIDQ
jgi:hypothetical protein